MFKMKCLIIFFVLISMAKLFSPVLGAVAIALPNPSRKPGGCYEDNVGHLSKEQVVPVPGNCESATCSADGSITYYSCSPIQVPSNCRISSVDLSKTYPDCCPKPIC